MTRWSYALRLIGVAVVYLAAGRLGLSLAYVNESASAVWPPTGIAIAAMLLFGTSMWPAVAVGAFLVNLGTSGVVASSAVIAAGDTLEGIAGAWLATRFARGKAAFERTGDILRFALIACTAAAAIAASLGVLALLLGGLASSSDADSIWFTWWLGDAVGGMVVTPLVILWARRATPAAAAHPYLETLALLVGLVLTAFIVFGVLPLRISGYPLEFLLVPALLWSAFRLGARKTVTISAVVAAIAILGTLRGRGPFAVGSPNQALLLLQAFIGVMTTMMLAVAAEVARRHSIEGEMRALNDALERRVAARTLELVKATDRLLEAQQVAQVGSWEWDVGSNALWWSEGLYRLYGMPSGEVTSYEAFLARVHPDDRELVQGIVGQAMTDQRAFTFEHRIVRPDGEVRFIYAAGRVVSGPDHTPVRMMGIGLDITERKQAEDERAQLIREQAARHEAEEMSRAKDEFLAILSHELRTPLNAALGWAHMLRDLPHADPRSVRATDAIYRNLFVQARLVSDIMDVSRIARGTLLLAKGRIDLETVIDAAIDMVRDAADARGVTIESQLDETCEIVADSKRLQQVLWNLLSNAVKFGREGGRVRVIVRREETAVHIAVEDDGPGIAPEFLPHVFDQFRQADASSTRRHDGLGLGLAIARHIVEQHGGSIAASNRTDGGASFVIRLPARSAVVLSGSTQLDEFGV